MLRVKFNNVSKVKYMLHFTNEIHASKCPGGIPLSSQVNQHFVTTHWVARSAWITSLSVLTPILQMGKLSDRGRVEWWQLDARAHTLNHHSTPPATLKEVRAGRKVTSH